MNKFFITGTLMLLVLMSSGCRSLSPNGTDTSVREMLKLPSFKRADKDASEAKPQPARMAVIWKDGIYEKPGSPVVRGFGARIFFYDAANESVKSEGELVVYGFDEDSSDEDQVPQKFVFRQSEFQTHYKNTDIGHSYSVWVPWEKVGGLRKTIALIPVFKTESGNVIRGEQSIAVLPGRSAKTKGESVASAYNASNGPTAIRAAGFEEQVGEDNAVASSMVRNANFISTPSNSNSIDDFNQATTITLPQHLADRMKQMPNDPPAESINRVKTTSFDSENPDAQPSRPAKTTNNSTSASEGVEVPASGSSQRRAFGQPGPVN